MMSEPFAQRAIHDDNLWEAIRHHREVFTSVKDVDYSPNVRKPIVLLPPNEVFKVWKDDYKAMRETMIFEEGLYFEQLMSRIENLQLIFRSV